MAKKHKHNKQLMEEIMNQRSPKVKAYYIECACGKDVIIEANDVYISASSSPCELCGSHGGVELEYTCPECKQRIEISLKDW